MVQGFSIENLFRINLVPGAGADGPKLTTADINQVKKLCALQSVEVPSDDIQEMVERENTFIGHYESEIAPQREERQ